MKKVLVLVIAFNAACGTNLAPTVVRANGRDVEIVEAGAGSATVVFESGLGDDWSPWDAVASAVSKQARVFAYSRPGYGESDPAATPRDASHIVEELRALLAARGYSPPYVLVGHSFGGTYMELFARSHPAEVAAVVLVDPRHRDFLDTCEAAHLDSCGLTDSMLFWLPQIQEDEYRAFAMASREIAAAGPFGSFPVRVLTGTDHGVSAAREALWESMLGALAAEAPEGRQILYPGASHYVQLDRAAEVAQVIAGVLVR